MELRMKYRIPSSYHSVSRHPLVAAWLKEGGDSQLDFLNWLICESKSDRVWGNFEDGWSIEFNDEAKYNWFVLKWG